MNCITNGEISAPNRERPPLDGDRLPWAARSRSGRQDHQRARDGPPSTPLDI